MAMSVLDQLFAPSEQRRLFAALAWRRQQRADELRTREVAALEKIAAVKDEITPRT